ncbi:MAG: sterol desaturase family protein [Gammaproteobacteria bacterium]
MAAFRRRYRAEEIPEGYSGRRHLAFTVFTCLGVIALAFYQLEGVRPAEWLTVPLTFLYANLAEYLGHRGPMHHPVRGLELLFRRHTGQHHHFFTHQSMALEQTGDYRAVLFPAVMILFFLVGFALPVWLILVWAFSANVAWLFVATAVAYFLNYEVLHFAYHAPPDSRVGRLPMVARLGSLHRAHHDPRLMQQANFNVTYPLGDWLFGTLRRADDTAPQATTPPGRSPAP